MKRKILLLIVLGIMVLGGCSDEFLAPKTLSIFTTDNVLVNEEGFDAALTSCGLARSLMNIMTIWHQL